MEQIAPYVTALKLLLMLAIYGALALTQSWSLLLVAILLALSLTLRNIPRLQGLSWRVTLPWVSVDALIWLAAQSINWQSPAVNAGIILAIDAAIVGWRLRQGALHWGAVAVILIAGPLLTGAVPLSGMGAYLAPLIPGLLISYGFVYLLIRVQESNLKAQQARAEAELANRQLREYASQIEELAIARERNRLAGEVHDSVAHTFTGILMQMDLIERLQEQNPEQARAAIGRVRAHASEALTEVRRSVHALRPERLGSAQGIAAIHQLVLDFGTNTGVKTDWQVEGLPVELTASQELCLFRSVQEGLTNALRHGFATQVWVTTTFRTEAVLLSLDDNGRAPKKATDPGIGLLGLRERAGLLGGEVTAGPRPEGGWHLQVRLPLAPQEGSER